MIADSEGTIVIATDPRWRGQTVDDALASQSPASALRRAIELTNGYFELGRSPDAYLRGEAVMRVDGRIPFRGWRLINFSTYASVRERVNGVLALEIMGFAILSVKRCKKPSPWRSNRWCSRKNLPLWARCRRLSAMS